MQINKINIDPPHQRDGWVMIYQNFTISFICEVPSDKVAFT